MRHKSDSRRNIFIAIGYKGPSIYDVQKEGVRLRWTHVDGKGGQLHMDVHNKIRDHRLHPLFFSFEEVGILINRIDFGRNKKRKFSLIIN